jgi:hypothetical protein
VDYVSWLGQVPKWHKQHGSTWKYQEYVSSSTVSSAQYLSAATDGTVASRSDRNNKVLVQVRKPYSGMTRLYRVFILIVVFFKFSICVALCIFGSAWIFSSDKAGELILNTLASVFIFQGFFVA